jgi:hypothetical protein
MPTLAIKSGTTAIAGSTVKGSFSYFSGSTKDLGPTSSTGFYSGIDAPSGGYTVYQIGGSGGWTARVATDTTSLNSILISYGGTGSTVDQNITWATNTNSVFINSGATSSPTYTVGQSALGGKIGYILQSGDPGYDANVQHGLVVATVDQSAAEIWGCATTSITGLSGAIGSGLANTNAILTQCATRPIAASVARAYAGGGYTDWYLPSSTELYKLNVNLNSIGAGFSNSYYWTSTQFGTPDAYDMNMGSTGQILNGSTYAKGNTDAVRAIRSF